MLKNNFENKNLISKRFKCFRVPKIVNIIALNHHYTTLQVHKLIIPLTKKLLQQILPEKFFWDLFLENEIQIQEKIHMK